MQSLSKNSVTDLRQANQQMGPTTTCSPVRQASPCNKDQTTFTELDPGVFSMLLPITSLILEAMAAPFTTTEQLEWQVLDQHLEFLHQQGQAVWQVQPPGEDPRSRLVVGLRTCQRCSNFRMELFLLAGSASSSVANTESKPADGMSTFTAPAVSSLPQGKSSRASLKRTT